MFYYLFEYLQDCCDFPGAGLFQYISFRAAMAVITSLIITLLFGKRWIRFLNRRQVGETIRDLGLEGQMEKEGTPTMGGLIILNAVVIPTLLFAKLDNIYIILMLFTTVWLGMIGFADDYIKVFKKNKKGLPGKYKVLGQIILGLVVGLSMYFNEDIVIREKITDPVVIEEMQSNGKPVLLFSEDAVKSQKTTIPFFKNNELDYQTIISWIGDGAKSWTWIIFIPIVILIITAVSNGANLTDGMDGLATGTSAIIGVTLAVLAWVSGNIVFADYLNIMYIPNTGELTIFISAFVGACIG
ncbi:MAG: phospho-N-acetylmuramoyl-pentapeptide-transferase, partial [Bacteroidales bacterium]|nr:phospho-N-acetylmuramoyl-pentapeptide-transferase [Bacteroidales bacterium]